MIQNLINHMAFVVDQSSSMSPLAKDVVRVFDREIEAIKHESVTALQETRISVYTFDSSVRPLIFDMDAMRVPSLNGYYKPNGTTALSVAITQAIEDLQKTAQMYGDHAFLIYVLTDGQEYPTNARAQEKLRGMLPKLPENWTVAALVPDQSASQMMRDLGFPAGSLRIWDVSQAGIEQEAVVLRSSMSNYMAQRAKGIRGSSNFFNVDVTGLTKTAVVKKADELSAAEFEVLPVYQDIYIKDFVEKVLSRNYRNGAGYYQLTKPEMIQAHKSIALQEISTGRVYTGSSVRNMLGLPDHDIKVQPSQYDSKWRIFVQSTAPNRKLIRNTFVLILK